MLGSLNKAWCDVVAWQERQFPEGTIEGAAAHLHKEAAEVRSAVELREPPERIIEECADVFFLLARIAAMCGEGPFTLAYAVERKLAANMRREWPATPDADGVYAHRKAA